MPNTREMSALLRKCLHFNYDEFNGDTALCVDLTAENLIANGVTVQKPGRWIKHIFLGHEQWVCSECQTLGSPQWKCCPVCEAKMPLPEPPKGE